AARAGGGGGILLPLPRLCLAAGRTGRFDSITPAGPAHLRLSGEGRDHAIERGREPCVCGGRIACWRQLGEPMAGRGVTARVGLGRGAFSAAARDPIRAARVETAARRRGEGARDVALQDEARAGRARAWPPAPRG